MYQFLYILLLSGLVLGFVPENSLRDDGEDLDLNGLDPDIVDVIEDYDEATLMANQDAIDERLQTVIFSQTKRDGYPLEEHSVTTDDGYILKVHRIPYGQFNGGVANKPVVFLQHGLLSCSYHWVLEGPGRALAYVLADQGYDVWMGNARGNSYSKKHIKLSTKKKDFWDFSWHEIGYYDLPAMIDYVLRNTQQNALNYVGHSQGTTSFYVMASTRPEYNKKIKAMHSLAPVAFMSNMFNPLARLLGPLIGKAGVVSKLIGSFEFLPSSKLITLVGSTACKDGSIFQVMCTNAIFMMGGFSHDNMNATLLPEIMKSTPAGASVNQMIHYAQEISSGKFRQFDYGAVKNLIKYKSLSPPDYNLGKISAPVLLYYSSNDWLAAVKDVQTLASKLGNVVYNTRVPHDTFNHMDFLWGVNVIDLVYNNLIANIKKFP